VHHFVNQFVANLEQSQTKAEKKRVLPTEIVKQWIAPPQGVTKVNIAATVSKNTGRGSVAAIARDHIDLFLGASALAFRWLLKPLKRWLAERVSSKPAMFMLAVSG
jgi:hypothetical protein